MPSGFCSAIRLLLGIVVLVLFGSAVGCSWPCCSWRSSSIGRQCSNLGIGHSLALCKQRLKTCHVTRRCCRPVLALLDVWLCGWLSGGCGSFGRRLGVLGRSGRRAGARYGLGRVLSLGKQLCSKRLSFALVLCSRLSGQLRRRCWRGLDGRRFRFFLYYVSGALQCLLQCSKSVCSRQRMSQ